MLNRGFTALWMFIVLTMAGMHANAAVAVSVSPASVTVAPGGKQVFTATVSGSANTDVAWTIVPSGKGSLSALSGITTTYTTPAVAGTYKIRATSKVDSTKYAEATVIVPITIAVSPSTATVLQKAKQSFSAIVKGTATTTVKWKVVSSGGGSITTSGVYTAPALAGTFIIRATSDASSSKYADATIIVPSRNIVISPADRNLEQGSTQSFIATVSGSTSNSVIWSVVTAGGGSINTNTGLYTAPFKSGTFVIKATSTADSTLFATASITVQSISISISPKNASVLTGSSTLFSAIVSGISDKSISWSCSGGAIDSNTGAYTAPASAGNFMVTASCRANLSVTASVPVTVIQGIVVTVSPSSVTLDQGASQQFQATVVGAANTNIKWVVVAGAPGDLSASGLYKAPSREGTYKIAAVSLADDTKQAEATIIVRPVSITIAPLSGSVSVGKTKAFTANVTGSVDKGVVYSCLYGNIDNGGIYMAPMREVVDDIVVYSVADNSKKASTSISVTDPANVGKITLSFPSINVISGGNLVIKATVQDSTQGVAWSINNGSGSISSDTLTYTYKALSGGIPLSPGASVVVTAKSKEYPNQYTTVTLQVHPVGTTLVITPSAPTCLPGATIDFKADVLGESDQRVVWESSISSISNTGQFVAPSSEMEISISAKSIANSGKSGLTKLTVLRQSNFGKVTITPSLTFVPGGQSIAVSAVSAGSSQGVSWALTKGWYSYKTSEKSTKITYQASDYSTKIALKPGFITITARSIEYPDQVASCNIEVLPVGTLMVVRADSDYVVPGGVLQFKTIILDGTSSGINWSVDGGGSITTTGLFVAGMDESLVTITAATVSVPAKIATTRVWVCRPENIGIPVISPNQVVLRKGEVVTFNAVVKGAFNGIEWWSFDGGDYTSDSNQAIYTAGSYPGQYSGSAVSFAGKKIQNDVNISIYPENSVIGIAPQKLYLLAGEKFQFSASLFGAAPKRLVWSADVGQIDSGGLYTAPLEAGVATVTVSIEGESSTKATCAVTLHNNPVIEYFLAHPARAIAGENVKLQWRTKNALKVVLESGVSEPFIIPNFGELMIKALNSTVDIVANNANGSVRQSVKLDIIYPDITAFSVSKNKILRGSTVTVNAVFENASGKLKYWSNGEETDLGEIISGVARDINIDESGNIKLEIANSFGVMRERSIFVTVVSEDAISAAYIKTSILINPANVINLRSGDLVVLSAGVNNNSALLLVNSSTGEVKSGGQLQQGTISKDSLLCLADGTITGLYPIYPLFSGHPVYWYSWNSSGATSLNTLPFSEIIGRWSTYEKMANLINNRIVSVGQYYRDVNGIGKSDKVSWYDPVSGWSVSNSLVDRAYLTEFAILPDGRVVIGGENAELLSYPGHSISLGKWPSEKLIVLPDGRVMCLGDSEILIWDPLTGNETRQPSPLGALRTYDHHVLPNGNIVFLGSVNGGIYILDSKSLSLSFSEFKTSPSSPEIVFKPYVQTLRAGIDKDGSILGLVSAYTEPSGNIPSSYVCKMMPSYDFLVYPAKIIQTPGERVQFRVTKGDASGVVWQASQGVILQDGTFECNTSGRIVITATSKTGQICYAWVEQPYAPLSAEAWVPDSENQNIRLSDPSVPTGGMISVRAMLKNHPNQGFSWQVEEGSIGGSIKDSRYYAPLVPGKYHLIATSLADARYSAKIEINVAPALVIRPTVSKVLPLSVVRLWMPSGAKYWPRVTWTQSGGNPVVEGETDWNLGIMCWSWTAPSEPGVYTLTATRAGDVVQTQNILIEVLSHADKAIILETTDGPYVKAAFYPPLKQCSWRVRGTTTAYESAGSSGLAPYRLTLIGPLEFKTPLNIDLGERNFDSGSFVVPSLPGTYAIRINQINSPQLFAETIITVLDAPSIIDFQAPSIIFNTKPYSVSWSTFNATTARLNGRLLETTSGAASYSPADLGDGSVWKSTFELYAIKGSNLLGLMYMDRKTVNVIRGELSLIPENSQITVEPGQVFDVNITGNLYAGEGEWNVGYFLRKHKLDLDTLFEATRGSILNSNKIDQFKLESPAGSPWLYTYKSSARIQAPLESGDFIITAKNAASSAVSSIAVKVNQGIGIIISPVMITVYTGQTIQFAYNTNASNGAVNWSTTNGLITKSGLFTAPPEPGTAQVIVSLVDGQNKMAVANVTIEMAQVTLDIVKLATPVYVNESIQFHYNMNAPTNRVVWNATHGFITSTGLYTAPGSPCDDYVTVTSVDDTTKSSSSWVSVREKPVVKLTPKIQDVFVGKPYRFGTNVYAADPLLDWSIDSGSIASDGIFKPQATGIYTITAKLHADPNIFDTAIAKANEPVARFEPRTLDTACGASIQLGFTYNAPGRPVFACTSGQIDSSGRYTAPTVPGIYTVTLSSDDPDMSGLQATAVIKVDPIRIVVSPSFVSLVPNAQIQFGAATNLGDVTWSVDGAPSSGIITGAGLYTAPSQLGKYTVRAISTLDPKVQQVALVRVLPVGSSGSGGIQSGGSSTVKGLSGVELTLSPTFVSMDAGMVFVLEASVSGSEDTGVDWGLDPDENVLQQALGSANSCFAQQRAAGDITNASVDANGTFIANKKGYYVVRATSRADRTVTATVIFAVNPALHINSATPITDLQGYSITKLDNGKLLIAGGISYTSNEKPETDDSGRKNWTYSGKAWLYDPETQQFTRTGDMRTSRGYHHATALSGGRVLITAGSAQWVDPWSQSMNALAGIPWAGYFPFAEIYVEATGQFQDLPSQQHPYLTEKHSLYNLKDLSGPGMMWSDHDYGTAIKMNNGNILVAGGDGVNHGWLNYKLKELNPSHQYTCSGGDVFDHIANKFDLDGESKWRTLGFKTENYSLGCGWRPGMVNLLNGRVLLTPGLFNDNLAYSRILPVLKYNPLPLSKEEFKPLLIDVDTGAISQTEPMVLPRYGQSLTVLGDGRVLAVSGADYSRCVWNGTRNEWIFSTTATAEIYEPSTKKWTATGSLKQARLNHAAVLLPTGKVLIVGGTHISSDGESQYPNLIEVFDPDSGTFSVMDKLDYGLSEPKAVLLNDGSVFLAGQIQAPMEPPPALKTQGMRMMAANAADATLTVGSSVFGTVAPSTMGWVTEVQWGSAIPVSLGQQTVPLPHWKFGVGVEDGQGSKRPAVYTAFGPNQNGLQVKLKLFKGMFTHGSGKLIGTLAPAQLGGGGAPLGQLQMEGDFTLIDGEQVVPLQITNMPGAVNWYRGDVTWKVQTSQGTVDLQGRTRLEMFVVLGQPTSLFAQTGGVWIEVLRMLGEKASILGVSSAENGVKQVTNYLHWGHGLVYDTNGGASHYGFNDGSGGTFNLSDYLSHTSNKANCFDQAGAIQVFSASLGIQCQWILMSPFGYITDTHLLGIDGICNNPFFGNGWPSNEKWLQPMDINRQPFGCHAFVNYNKMIYDACAKPHLGTEDIGQYVDASVDATGSLYGVPGRPTRKGIKDDAVNEMGVTAIK